MFGTRYGSIDTEFRLNGEEKFTCVPEGIAHFLEHKLFESEDLDAFERYAKTGASANAYTSFDKTCYLFSCTGKFQESLEILLDFVTHPYFTEKTAAERTGHYRAGNSNVPRRSGLGSAVFPGFARCIKPTRCASTLPAR